MLQSESLSLSIWGKEYINIIIVWEMYCTPHKLQLTVFLFSGPAIHAAQRILTPTGPRLLHPP